MKLKEIFTYIKKDPSRAILDVLFVVMLFVFTYTSLCLGSIIQ